MCLKGDRLMIIGYTHNFKSNIILKLNKFIYISDMSGEGQMIKLIIIIFLILTYITKNFNKKN